MLWINRKAAVPKLVNLSHTSYCGGGSPDRTLLPLVNLQAPTAPSYLLLHHSLYHTASLTILLQRSKDRWLESARFWTHPIQHMQELHQD